MLIPARYNIAESPRIKLFLYTFTELAIIATAFCTNFISAFFFKNFFNFEDFRAAAISNALTIVRIERYLGIFVEEIIQKWHTAIFGGFRFWNAYYAAAHPTLLVFTLVVILVRSLHYKLSFSNWSRLPSLSTLPGPSQKSFIRTLNPAQQYILFRTAFILSIALSLIGFIFMPTMPPRLLPDCHFTNNHGQLLGACMPEFTFVDTIGEHGSIFFSWKDESVQVLNNPYAAFPSQHALVACWVAWVWFTLFASFLATMASPSSRFSKCLNFILRYLPIIYPVITIYCIIITANHFILDAFFGFSALLSAGIASYLYLYNLNYSIKLESEHLPL